MAKKPIMTTTIGEIEKPANVNLTRLELKQLEQMKLGIRISPCRGSVDPFSKSFIMDVTCSDFMSDDERLVACQSKNSEISLALIRRHYKFTLDNFPNLLKEELRESVENGSEVIRKRITRR